MEHLNDGDLFEVSFEVEDQVIDMLAEVSIEGSTLHLKDIAVYPRGVGKTKVGTEGVLAMRKTLTQRAKAAGFTELKVSGTRLSGAKEGKNVEISFAVDPAGGR